MSRRIVCFLLSLSQIQPPASRNGSFVNELFKVNDALLETVKAIEGDGVVNDLPHIFYARIVNDAAFNSLHAHESHNDLYLSSFPADILYVQRLLNHPLVVYLENICTCWSIIVQAFKQYLTSSAVRSVKPHLLVK